MSVSSPAVAGSRLLQSDLAHMVRSLRSLDLVFSIASILLGPPSSSDHTPPRTLSSPITPVRCLELSSFSALRCISFRSLVCRVLACSSCSKQQIAFGLAPLPNHFVSPLHSRAYQACATDGLSLWCFLFHIALGRVWALADPIPPPATRPPPPRPPRLVHTFTSGTPSAAASTLRLVVATVSSIFEPLQAILQDRRPCRTSSAV